MGSLSDYSENALLQHIFNTAYSSVATVYVALCTANPGEAATGASMSEVANTNAYQRTAITFAAAASRAVVQTGAVTFPTATGSWGTITDWAIVDSATYGAGNILAYGTFTASFAPVNGNTPIIPSGQIQVSMNASSGAGLVDVTVHKLLDRMFRNQAYAKPATYVGLATATIADSAATDVNVTEVSGGSYARKQVNISGGAVPKWNTSSGGVITNADVITFVTPTGSWGTVTSCFLIDSASGAGNIIGYDNANLVDQTIATNDVVQFDAAAFVVSLA
jgi:hypothetical protein